MAFDPFSVQAAPSGDGAERIAVIGAGVSGLSAAWLLSQKHDVTLYEKAARPGGHSHTVDAPGRDGPIPVDTGFIVYNEATYPNLTALFQHLNVATHPTEMTFSVSLDGGAFEYAGSDLAGLLAQPQNLLQPRFWRMIGDLIRFYRIAPQDAASLGTTSLGDYLAQKKFGAGFRDDHLLPMAAAIWSAPAQTLLDFPAQSFIRFCENHGLLKLVNRPAWRTVVGGSRQYVDKLLQPLQGCVRLSRGAGAVIRSDDGVEIVDARGETERFDKVIIATHADEALAALSAPTDLERRILGGFRYSQNQVVLHNDARLMPRRKAAWSAWNYLGDRATAEEARRLCVTYWMNRLQPLPDAAPWFVTLNPTIEPAPDSVVLSQTLAHPIFDAEALEAQGQLGLIQGENRTWYCGAHFGAGFHEDGLQAGLWAAEQAGGVRRPWTVAAESERIQAAISLAPTPAAVAAR